MVPYLHYNDATICTVFMMLCDTNATCIKREVGMLVNVAYNDETPHCAHRARCTTSRRERRVTGRFAPSSVRLIRCIQRFLIIQLKPKHVFWCSARGVWCGVSWHPNAGLYSRIYKAAICLVNEHIAVIIIHLGPTLDRAFVCDEQTLWWSLSKEPSDSIMLNE